MDLIIHNAMLAIMFITTNILFLKKSGEKVVISNSQLTIMTICIGLTDILLLHIFLEVRYIRSNQEFLLLMVLTLLIIFIASKHFYQNSKSFSTVIIFTLLIHFLSDSLPDRINIFLPRNNI